MQRKQDLNQIIKSIQQGYFIHRLISRIKIIAGLNTRPNGVKQCQEGQKFEAGHKKAPEKVLFYALLT